MQSDRIDKSAVSWDYHEKLDKHQSQINVPDKPSSVGKIKVPDFSERQEQPPKSNDRPATTGKIKVPNFSERQEQPKTNDRPVTTGKVKVPNFIENQTDRSKEASTTKSTPTGKIKVPSTFIQNEESNQTPTRSADNSINKSGNASALKSRFENLIKESDGENQRKIEEERVRRLEKERNEKNKAKREEEERQKKLRLEAEQRRLSESAEQKNESDESSSDEQVVSSKVNKIGISVLPTQGLAKQNSKTSNCSSPYDSDGENHFSDEENVQVEQQTSNQANSVDRTNVIETNQRTVEVQNEQNEPAQEEEDEDESIEKLKELELQRELEEEELRKKLAEDDESLVEDDTSEEKEIRAVALYDYEAAESDEISFLPGDVIGKRQ